MFFQVDAAQPDVAPEVITMIGSLQVTNAMILGVLLTIGLALFSVIYTRKPKLMPSKFQLVIEMIVESFITLLQQIMGTRKGAMKMLPLVGGIFVFFGISNLIGLIPGVTSITYDGTALLRTPTNDFNMTFSVATAIIILTQIASIQAFGLFGHIGKFVKVGDIIKGFQKGIGAGLFSIVEFALGLLDIVSEIAKVFSLSLRLFGNMYAGEVLMAVLLGAFAAVIPTVWLGMNVLVGVLQAMVFGALTAAYYALAIQKPGAEEVEESLS